MKFLTIQRQVTLAAFVFLFSASPLLAQVPVRVTTPGNAFTLEGSSGQVDDVTGGRRFRGKAGALLKLRALVRMPSASAADPKMLRLVVHFRTNTAGPSLRSVEVLNGTTAEFRIAVNLKGDYTVRETTAAEVANVWDLKSSPRKVSAQSVIRLAVQFPVGFDSPINPGEFVVTGVVIDFPAKAPPINEPSTRLPPLLPSTSKAVIYAVANNDDLLWYRHDGNADGSLRWTDPRKVGNGWGFRDLFSGGDGVIYAITSTGDLLWYRHDGHADGSIRWTEAKKVGNGWNFKKVFYGGGGVIYAIADNGDLLWYRHDGHADGSVRWTEPKKVGHGWNFKQVFSAGGGVIYAITDSGDLLWYRHDGHADGSIRWIEDRRVGNGWNFKQVFYGGAGVIYAITESGDLLWYRHDGYADGSVRWTDPKKVGNGWNFKAVFFDVTS